MNTRFVHVGWRWRAAALWVVGTVLLTFAEVRAPGQANPPLVLTNPLLLANGRAQFELLVPSNGLYTLEVSTDLKKWEAGLLLDATNSRVLITLPQPIIDMPTLFLRARVGRGLYTDLNLHFYAQPGAFNGGSTPAVGFPVALNAYTANLSVDYDSEFPQGADVVFTGPAGSGLAQAPSAQFEIITEEGYAWYRSPLVSSPVVPPAGVWEVSYKGNRLTFELPAPEALSHLVIPVPTVVVAGGVLQRVTWVYRSPTTGTLIDGAPPHSTSIQVQLDGSSQPGESSRLYESDDLSPTTTSHVLSAQILWNQVSTMHLVYDDDLENHYVISYPKQ